MFKAIKCLKIEGTNETKLQANTKGGKTVSTSREIEEVTKYFKQCFYKDSHDNKQIEESLLHQKCKSNQEIEEQQSSRL